MASVRGALVLLATLAIVYGHERIQERKYTTQTNLEKLFIMESELISMFDVFIRDEHFEHDGEDAHNLTEIRTLIKRYKGIHISAKNMTIYLAHPINVLHLTRRFVYDWPDALVALQESKPCKTWKMPDLMRRISNIEKNVPDKRHLKKVALGIARVCYTMNLNLEDLLKGIMFGKQSYWPVTTGDLVDIFWAAHEGGQFLTTTQLADVAIRGCADAKKENPNCKNLRLLKLAAACYYKVNNLKRAVEMTELILKENPDDRVAKRNLKFYSSRLKDGKLLEKTYAFDAPNVKFYQTCQGVRNMSVSQRSRLFCKMMPTSAWLVFEKGEFHNLEPPVIEIHQAFSRKYIMAIKEVGENEFKKQAYNNDLYQTPKYRHKVPNLHVYEVLSKRFLQLEGPLYKPYDIGSVEIRQAGIEGMYFKAKDRAQLPNMGGHIGSFFTFINDNYVGGEHVFPKYKLKIKPQKGNTIFFFPTKTTLNICPVAYGTQWYTIQSLFELKSKTCRQHDRDIEENF